MRDYAKRTPLSEKSTKRLSQLLGPIDDSDSECCICMEKKSDIALNCSHSFCKHCIEGQFTFFFKNEKLNQKKIGIKKGWKQKSRTCPICRKNIEREDDEWEIMDEPNPSEINDFFVQQLKNIASQSKWVE